jgi:hypothetical protein
MRIAFAWCYTAVNMKKTFDCTELQHIGAERIYEETRNMTLEEEAAYWEERTGAFRKRQQTLREQQTSLDKEAEATS